MLQSYPVHTAARFNSNAPRFGCRLFAYATPSASTTESLQKEEATLLQQVLRDGCNSMKGQSLLPLRERGNTTIPFDPKVASREHEGVSKAGWGFAYSPSKDALITTKSPTPAWKDTAFDETVDHIAKQAPKTMLGHLREAFSTQDVYLKKEAHPFQLGDWALIHNGCIPEPTIKNLQSALEKAKLKDAAVILPESNVDTEKVACYLSEALRQVTGANAIKGLETGTVKNIFKNALTNVIQWPNDTPPPTNPEDYPGSFNFMVTDGDRIFASRYGKIHTLNVGTRTNQAGDTEYLLATDPIQPEPRIGLGPITWREIPHNSLITLERKKNGRGQTEIVFQEERLIAPKATTRPSCSGEADKPSVQHATIISRL